MSTYIIPDTHGCLKTLRFLLEHELKVSKSDHLFFLGDYIDRGPLSAQLVNYLIGLVESNYNITCLKGNHEQMLLDASLDTRHFNHWMANSGMTTLYSYSQLLGISYDKMELAKIPDTHLAFYKSLPVYQIVDNKFILVHGGLDFREEDPFANDYSMLWKRPETLPEWFLPDKMIIHGHTPVSIKSIIESIKDPANRLINLDAGCVYHGTIQGTGYLTALNIDNWELTYVEYSE